MQRGVYELHAHEGLFVEPSCAAAFGGLAHLDACARGEGAAAFGGVAHTGVCGGAEGTSNHQQGPSGSGSSGSDEQQQSNSTQSPHQPSGYAKYLLESGVHVLWMTGGSLVPESERVGVLEAGRGVSAEQGPRLFQ